MRVIDARELRKLFKEEFKRTKKMIDDGQTHLDTLAEGYAEADHLLRFRALTVDAIPVVRRRDCIEFEEIGKYPMGMPEHPDGESFGYLMFGRSAGAIATRVSYLVGIKKVSEEVAGKFVGYLDGKHVEGVINGTVRKDI